MLDFSEKVDFSVILCFVSLVHRFSTLIKAINMLRLLGIKSSRGTQLVVNFIIFTCIWSYLSMLELGEAYRFTISALPYWALMSFGSYALWKIGRGLATLRDCVKESAELEQEIKEAKAFLASRGFKLN